MVVARTPQVSIILQIYLVITLGNVLMNSAYVFKRCELALELLSHNFSRSDLHHWVCLVENESARNSSAVGGPNSNGSFVYGIFQINSQYWCGEGKDCKIPYSALTDDDLADDAKCALKIFKRHQFNAWHGWTKRCKNSTTLPNLVNCFSTNQNDGN